MPDLIPVEHDPFAVTLTPVDHDPFAVPVGEPSGQVSRVLGAIGRGIADWAAAPGRIVQQRPPRAGDMVSDEAEALRQINAAGQYTWGPQTALNMVGGGSPFAAEGAAGVAGGKLYPTLQHLRDEWTANGVRNFVADRSSRGELQLSDLVVPKEMRGQGVGTKFMNDLMTFADANGRTVTLTPDVSYGASSISRLKEFYKRLGFVENKGRNINYTISDSMYRRPQADTTLGSGATDKDLSAALTGLNATQGIRAYHGSPHDADKAHEAFALHHLSQGLRDHIARNRPQL